MRGVVKKLANKGLLWTLRRSLVAEFHGVRIASTGTSDPTFVPVITAALELVRALDPRRFTRLKEHIDWIFDHAHPDGSLNGSYLPGIRGCRLDFENHHSEDDLVLAGSYAGLIVHEATHATLIARGIDYTPENRAQVERICYAEQNRFLRKLNAVRPGLGDSLIVEYDPTYYGEAWTRTKLQSLAGEVRRVLAKETSNQAAERTGAPRSGVDRD